MLRTTASVISRRQTPLQHRNVSLTHQNPSTCCPAHAISDSHPFPSQPRVFPQRITGETLRRPSSVSDGGPSIDEPVAPVHAVDNPRYAVIEAKMLERSPRKAGMLGRRGSNASASGGRLFGSLKGFKDRQWVSYFSK
ncbi:hypothetical protein C0992_004891 [Termitomyces sp. T32_za158]|nr:hypothetical protein C0992_004891 [Termitomyces sp. T32_za158]